MPRSGRIVPTKIRKRGCSPSSSSSSIVHNHRLNKRAIFVGKSRGGLVGSRSTTPVPTWRTTALKIESPKYSQSGRSTRPVSARRLAAHLWEINEMGSPRVSESNCEVMKDQKMKKGSKMCSKREKMWGVRSGSGYLPPHLSDPSHSPTGSEKMDRSRTGSRQRRTPSISQRLRSAEQNGAFDSISNTSFMEIETRSSSGVKNPLKDVSNALITSKELLKIISRIWAHVDQPSSSTSLISALHAELERARLQVNHLIQEQRSDKNEINSILKRFAEEKSAWKNQERENVESAISLIAGELDLERKLRHRVESLNKKLGKELAEMKLSFMKLVEELENEKRAREATEIEKAKRASLEVREDVVKERDLLELADKLHGSKNSAINKLRKQLEGFLGTKREKFKVVSHQDGEVEDALDGKEDYSDNANKWCYNTSKSRNSTLGQDSRKSASFLRAGSDVQNSRNGFDKEMVQEMSGYKSVKARKDQVLLRDYNNSSLQREESWPLRDPLSAVQERSSGSKLRTGDVRGEGQTRRSKW